MTKEIALYVHWPFCQSKCPYCDFNSHVSEFIDQSRWRKALVKELEHYALETPDRRLTSIFFGGGTPSLMSPETVFSVIEAARGHWHIDHKLEVTLEANPSSSDRSRFAAYQKSGINRLSLGVQSLNNRTLDFLGRNHTAIEAQCAMTSAREIFDRVSFDFIYAWPEQTTSTWKKELKTAIDLSGDHLSLYQLTIEPGTPFYRDNIPATGQDLGAKLFEITLEITAIAGFRAYEISNHSKPGFESRHNLNYWEGGDYVGIGPGAHGRLSSPTSFTATHQIYNPDRWLNAVEHVGHGTGKRRPIEARKRAEEMIMTGLRLAKGLDTSAIALKTGLGIAELVNQPMLELLLKEGLLENKGHYLAATPAGWLVLNSAITALLDKKDVNG